MTELSYTISDIQTRIFEIQELRHKSQATGDSSGTTTIIDQSLMSLDERIETVSKGMKSISDSLEPIIQSAPTPTTSQSAETSENAAILRKHAELVTEWDAVQDESDVLREELKEDKWLTVFRTVTDQADGMMSSLEKAVNRCQEFIWQIHRDPLSLSTSDSLQRIDKTPSLEVYNSLLESFEAKKKHYMPATSKVLSIIDKGVRDRVTKNGETLRRHAESAQRWKNLKERIARTDSEMEIARKTLLGSDAHSENGSTASGTTSNTRNGYLNTPPSSQKRAGSASSTLSRSISPFRKFARKIAGNTVTPLTINKNPLSRTPSSEPPLAQSSRRNRSSIFGGFRSGATPMPTTPDRPGHKYSQSATPETPPRPGSTSKTGTMKQRWNSSTKVTDDRSSTVKATPPKRSPSAAGTYSDMPSIGGVFRRSFSRTSMASSRPWSPVTSSVSTTQSSSRPPPMPSSSHPPLPSFRPPSRGATPSRPQTPSRSYTPHIPMTPRARPKTPSHIPAPSNKLRSIAPPQSDDGWDDEIKTTTTVHSSISPASTSGGSSHPHPPRPPSRSMIPIPTLHLSSASRPGSSMSNNDDGTFKSAAARAQTPEFALRARVQQLPVFPGTPSRQTGRPSLPGSGGKLPPSSFHGSSSRAQSRSGSRNGNYTPTMDNLPLHEYVPGNPNDPLDSEVAFIVNSISHGLLVERIDPPLKKIPKEGEEIKAQYAFSNALSRKVITCRLSTLTRSGKADMMVTKKVMCRVGGGWQDLHLYILNRQAGM
ncbi:hypothetical protein FB45DRAFT_97756 [Roridomyces roridus]|uniref:GAR domain-containing protein n=1 Tax=Roridomyces roridus TaxID=1738132 RepID=A0AAD7FJS5_9AGAR|nr:hypothetical protein FB45DRAFT_97756 [Roridomyces roridus]